MVWRSASLVVHGISAITYTNIVEVHDEAVRIDKDRPHIYKAQGDKLDIPTAEPPEAWHRWAAGQNCQRLAAHWVHNSADFVQSKYSPGKRG